MKHRMFISAALATVACAALVATAVAAPKNRLFQFSGEVLGTSTSALQIQVESGNPVALRALIGESQNQTFSLGPNTEILVWQKGVPHVASVSDLNQGDTVVVNVRAARRIVAHRDREHPRRHGRRPRQPGARPDQAAVPVRRHRRRRAGRTATSRST